MTTPLITALDNQDVQLAILHIQNRVGLEDRDRHGNTPLHLTVLYGFRRVLKLLLELDSGVNILAINDQNETPLHIAARRGSPDIVGFLIKYGAMNDERNVHGDTPLCVASIHRNQEVKYIILRESIVWNPER